jgi:carbon-monoxide dehydrogenase medium subunit
MTPFELAEPTTIADALRLLDPDDDSVRPLGGGTALMLMMKAGVFRPTRLVSLRKIATLSGVAAAPDGGLVVGALTPLSDVEHSAEVARRAGVIVRTMRRLSNVRVRNVATIGGNLAHGDPHMDLPPVLMALDASILVVGRSGERTLRVENLFVGYYETVLKRDEIIAELRVPAQGTRRAAYLKCTTGSADDWPALGVAVSLEADGQAIRAPRVVVSAATEKAIRLKGAEEVLSGATIDDAVLARAGAARAGSRAAKRSPAAPNTPTTCACPGCCTARCSARRSRTAASSRSTPAPPGRCRASTGS